MARIKSAKAAKPPRRVRQYAVIPVRFDPGGGLEVLLLTSRGTRRWIIPKGWPMRKRAPGAAAAREAYEEAGVEGVLSPRTSIGSYQYAKRLKSGELAIDVTVFLLRVERQLESWPQQHERETRWFRPEEAAALVAEPDLATLLLQTRALVEKAQARARGAQTS